VHQLFHAKRRGIAACALTETPLTDLAGHWS